MAHTYNIGMSIHGCIFIIQTLPWLYLLNQWVTIAAWRLRVHWYGMDVEISKGNWLNRV